MQLDGDWGSAKVGVLQQGELGVSDRSRVEAVKIVGTVVERQSLLMAVTAAPALVTCA